MLVSIATHAENYRIENGRSRFSPGRFTVLQSKRVNRLRAYACVCVCERLKLF